MKTLESNLKRHMIIAKTIAVSIAIFMCASCDSGNDKRLANVKSDPAGTYREYLSDVRKLDNLSIKDLAEHLKQWQTVRDSVSGISNETRSPGFIQSILRIANGRTIPSGWNFPDWLCRSPVLIRMCCWSRNRSHPI